MQAIQDDLSDWALLRGPDFFIPPDSTLLPSLAVVSELVVGEGRYEAGAINTFMQRADYYLVASALAGQHSVVTLEVSSGSNKKIKIPDVCLGLKITCMSPYEMLRRERARFVLGIH